MEAVEMFPEMRAQPASADEAIPVLDVGLYLLQSKEGRAPYRAWERTSRSHSDTWRIGGALPR
jgi:hypothetical protein